MRQQYALKLIELLQKGKRIINIDESFLNEHDYQRRIWRPRGENNSMPIRTMTPRISVFVALDNFGEVHMSLSQDNTDTKNMVLFLHHLIIELDHKNPLWRNHTIL